MVRKRENDKQLSRIKLFSELKKYATYKKSARFGSLITPGFIGIILK